MGAEVSREIAESNEQAFANFVNHQTRESLLTMLRQDPPQDRILRHKKYDEFKNWIRARLETELKSCPMADWIQAEINREDADEFWGHVFAPRMRMQGTSYLIPNQ